VLTRSVFLSSRPKGNTDKAYASLASTLLTGGPSPCEQKTAHGVCPPVSISEYFFIKSFGRLDGNTYLCNMVEQEMKREMGKWLMGIVLNKKRKTDKL